MNLRDDDELIGVRLTDGRQEIAANLGSLVVLAAEDARLGGGTLGKQGGRGEEQHGNQAHGGSP